MQCCGLARWRARERERERVVRVECLACTGAGGEGGEGVDVGAGVLGRRGEAAGTGCEGVARMWIGYADVDRLITYPDAHNLSGCR